MNDRRGQVVVGGVVLLLLAGLAFWLLQAPPSPSPPPPTEEQRARHRELLREHGDPDRTIAEMHRRAAEEWKDQNQEQAPRHVDAGAPASLSWSTKQQLAAQAEIAAFLEKNAAEAARTVDAFCEENRRVAEKGFFRGVPGTADAVDYMVPRMDWEGNIHPPGLLHPADDLKARMSSYATDWPSQVTDADLSGVDLSWMKRLMSFDRWSMPMDLLTTNPSNFFEDEIPNYVSYQLWAKLQLAQGLKNGDIAEASAEVRHLADLLHTQGTLIADLVGVAILRIEQRSHDALAAAGTDVAAWPAPTIDEATANELREVSLAGPRYFYPGVSPEVVAKAAACVTTSPCPAFLEGLGAQSVLGSYSSADNRELIEAASAKAGCDPKLAERTKHYSGATVDKALELANNARPFNFTFVTQPAPKP
jgi:hypothetical protein